MKKSKPLLITFEGIDGSGKSTQCKILYHSLLAMEYTVHLYREPGGTQISEKIRDILLDRNHTEMSPVTEMLLYFASRNQLLVEKIKPALENNEIVLLDRFVDSTLAYQGYGRSLNIENIMKVREVAIGHLEPDITVLVDTPIDMAATRMEGSDLDRLEAENLSFKKRTREGYLKLAFKEPKRYFVVDGRESIESIKKAIMKRIMLLLEEPFED